LVYALGVWSRLGFRLTACAAAFFAVYEGHQEAVMWVSAANETLMACFGLAALICWIRFLEGGKWAWYAGSPVLVCAALLSKESAVVFVPLLALPLAFDRRNRRKPTLLLPIAAMAALSAWSIFRARSISFRFQDGSFSLHAPFWLTWPNNYGRLFWIWGLIGLIAVLLWKPAGYRAVLAIGASWAGFPAAKLTWPASG
jgi:hypothetical protein